MFGKWIEDEVKKGGVYVLFIGVIGWGDYDFLYINFYENRNKLWIYSEYFFIVEVDSLFYVM